MAVNPDLIGSLPQYSMEKEWGETKSSCGKDTTRG